MKIKHDSEYKEKLIQEVENLISDYGDYGGFNCDEWTEKWINAFLPAINEIPGELENTEQNKELLINILGRAASGVFS